MQISSLKLTPKRIIIALVVIALAGGIWRALSAKRTQQLAASDAALTLILSLVLTLTLSLALTLSPMLSCNQSLIHDMVS